MKFKFPLIELKELLNEASPSRCLELLPDRKYRILGVRWYAKGAFVKSESRGDEIKAKNAYLVKEGDLIYNRLFAWKGSFAIIPKELDGSFVSNEFPIFTLKSDKIISYYLFSYFSLNSVWDRIELLSKGVSSISRNRLKVSDLLSLKIPLPPINVQQSVVNKIEKIDYKSLKLIELQEKNDELIFQLRQAILQEAVQGKLVPQDRADEPASELLKRIKAEKQGLMRKGKIKREKPLPAISEGEIPYELPDGWVWCRLGEIAKLLDYGTSQKASFIANGIPVLGMNNIKDGEVIYNNFKYIQSTNKYLPRLYLKKNDLLFNRTNSYELVGKTGIHKKEDDSFTFASYLIRVSLLQDFTDPDFINFYFSTPTCRNTQIEPYITQQTGQANFNGTKLKNVIIPLPPLNEQKRIVAKVDELMKLCDELEEQIRQSTEESERLMQAVLREAFEGKDVEESKAEVSVA